MIPHCHTWHRGGFTKQWYVYKDQQWTLGIKDILEPAILSTIERLSSSLCTVEPRNKGHIGTSHFVHYREVVLFLMYSGTSE